MSSRLSIMKMKPPVATGSQIDFRVQFLRFLIHF